MLLSRDSCQTSGQYLTVLSGQRVVILFYDEFHKVYTYVHVYPFLSQHQQHQGASSLNGFASVVLIVFIQYVPDHWHSWPPFWLFPKRRLAMISSIHNSLLLPSVGHRDRAGCNRWCHRVSKGIVESGYSIRLPDLGLSI